jgi:hypothetical protein
MTIPSNFTESKSQFLFSLDRLSALTSNPLAIPGRIDSRRDSGSGADHRGLCHPEREGVHGTRFGQREG